MRRSRIVTERECHEPYELAIALGFGLDVVLVFMLGFLIGRLSALFF